MKLGQSHGHGHTWDGKSKRTSWDAEHDHAVSDPDSGWTGPGGMADHKHRIPKLKARAKGKALGNARTE